MSGIPDYLDLERHRDLRGRGSHVWLRRVLLSLVLVVPILALLNAFGQRPSTSRAAGAAGSLEVRVPSRVRGGLLYEMRVTVSAHEVLKHPAVVLDPEWAEGITINTIEPSPTDESSDDGQLVFHLGELAVGDSFVLFLQFQANPTTVGRRSATVTLRDADTTLATVHRSLTIFP